MEEFKCRTRGYSNWNKVKASEPALAAQLFAEDTFEGVKDGDIVEVQGYKPYRINHRVVVTLVN